MSIILFLIILAVLVVSHEFGHFIVAKMFGIRVDEFGFGFPPRIFGVKKGETTYTLNAIPFGGFVKIWGEDPSADPLTLPDYERSFAGKPKRVQAAVIVAGVVFNLLLAWLLLSVGFMVGMPTSAENTTLGVVQNAEVRITEVLSDSPASKAGLMPGDHILSLSEGTSVLTPSNSQEVQEFIRAHSSAPITLNIERGAETQSLAIQAETREGNEYPVIGVAMDTLGTVQLNPFRALIEGAKLTFELTKQTASGLYGFAKSLFSAGGNALNSVTGPIGLIGLVGSSAAFGFTYLLSLTAVISINLAIMNMIPFPALDGGRLLFIAIEKIKGTPVSSELVNKIHAGGFIVLLLLMAFITWHDIAKLIMG